jgi:hypothetical protein
MSLGTDERPTQFGIRQFMIFTAIVSVILGIGRALFPYLPLLGDARGEWPIFLFLAIASIVMTLPLVLAALLPRYALPSVGGVLILIACATFAELPLLNTLLKNRGGPGGPDIWHFLWINGFTVGWILAMTGLVRWAGYRLQTRGS